MPVNGAGGIDGRITDGGVDAPALAAASARASLRTERSGRLAAPHEQYEKHSHNAHALLTCIPQAGKIALQMAIRFLVRGSVSDPLVTL